MKIVPRKEFGKVFYEPACDMSRAVLELTKAQRYLSQRAVDIFLNHGIKIEYVNEDKFEAILREINQGE